MLNRYLVFRILHVGGLAVMALGLILGIIFAFVPNVGLLKIENEFTASIMFDWWIRSFTFGGLLLGVSTIIEILGSSAQTYQTNYQNQHYQTPNSQQQNYQTTPQHPYGQTQSQNKPHSY